MVEVLFYQHIWVESKKNRTHLDLELMERERDIVSCKLHNAMELVIGIFRWSVEPQKLDPFRRSKVRKYYKNKVVILLGMDRFRAYVQSCE